jgi:hypothetical protein
VPPRKRPATTVDATGQQVGDQSVSAAGGDIHQGIPPETAFDLVRFLWEDRQDRDIRREQLDHTLQDMRDAIELYRITLAQRITAIAVAVDALTVASSLQARETRRSRRWLFVLTIAWLVGVVAWVLIAWRVFLPPVDAATLLRLALGGALPSSHGGG